MPPSANNADRTIASRSRFNFDFQIILKNLQGNKLIYAEMRPEFISGPIQFSGCQALSMLTASFGNQCNLN